MRYCKLPAKRDYWKQHTPYSCLLFHWMDSVYFRDNFEYVWQNILLDGCILHKHLDNNVPKSSDGEFVDGDEDPTQRERAIQMNKHVVETINA